MLRSCTSGVLAVHGDGGYPYAVPLSYAYDDGRLFFHCAAAGHKLDAIARSDKVSFCVIAADEVVPSTFTTHFRSAVVFGRARVLTDDAQRRHALECLAKKYSPCLLYTSDAADDLLCVDLGGRRIIKKKKTIKIDSTTNDTN